MKPKNAFLLFLTSLIWGVAFVAQAQAADHIGAFTFNCVRSFLGALSLLPVILVMQINAGPKKEAGRRHGGRTLLTGGILCGICLFGGSYFQQLGIERSSVGKAGFITALYIVLVPIAAILLERFSKSGSVSKEEGSHKKITLPIIGSVILALIGLFLLCIKDEIRFETGDVFLILCALCFTVQILVIDHFSPLVDGVMLSCLEFFTASVISLPGMLLMEKPLLSELTSAAVPLLYAGVASCGIAYTLQILGQKNMNPTIASLIMSLESVVSALAGWLILGQRLSAREITGCVLMFAAILLANLSDLLTGTLKNG